jgi:hypothetical protein
MVTECYAGSRILAVNLQSGAVTPCITVPGPLLGNIFEDRLDLFEERPGKCTAQGVNCICDVHFQQNVVVGAEDAARFNELGRGSVAPRGYVGTIESMKANGGKFYGNPDAGMGNVEDMTRLAFTAEEVRKRFRLSGKATAAMPADVWEDPPARLAGEGRLAAFALSDLVPTESGSVEPGSRPELTTSPLQWAYVAVLPLPISADAGSGLSLRARFQVLEGSVGVGVLACDEKAFLSEGIVRAGEGRETTVRLPLPSPPATGPLIFRNVAANGVASRARLTSVELWGRAEALDAGNISGGPSNG